MKSKTKLLGLASAAALGLVSCTNDELREVYTGEELRFTTSVGRATPTTLENLDGFRVYADADGYKEMFIKGLTATRVEAGSGDYVLENKITWPVDVNKIRFWAYGPLDSDVTADITKNTQMLRHFNIKSNIVDGGKDHQDIVVAYNELTRGQASGMQVPLVFHHALSQIEVNIKKGEGAEEGRVVKVKGAWLMNVHSIGDLEFDFTAEDDEYMAWSTDKNSSTNYGRQLSEGTRLGNRVVQVISNGNNGSDNSSLMVIPQYFIEYPFKPRQKEVEEWITKQHNYNSSGTYILVLCRVETEHRYDPTPDGEAQNPAIGPLYDESGVEIGHIHQLFPVTTDAEGHLTYKEGAYGYSCVPIEGNWQPGKKYVYTLEFCGKKSGAGVYPPEDLPDNLPPGEPRPGDKHPGDPVLDDPISFSVTITDWVDNTADVPMN